MGEEGRSNETTTETAVVAEVAATADLGVALAEAVTYLELVPEAVLLLEATDVMAIKTMVNSSGIRTVSLVTLLIQITITINIPAISAGESGITRSDLSNHFAMTYHVLQLYSPRNFFMSSILICRIEYMSSYNHV